MPVAILCSMAAFKQHASFGYWKHALVVGEEERRQPREGMGSYGKLTVAEGPAAEEAAARAHQEGDAAQRGGREDAQRAQDHRAQAAAAGAGRPGRGPAAQREGQGHVRGVPAEPASASTSTGSARPSATRPGRSACRRPSSGWPRASSGTGSTRTAERGRWLRGACPRRRGACVTRRLATAANFGDVRPCCRARRQRGAWSVRSTGYRL